MTSLLEQCVLCAQYTLCGSAGPLLFDQPLEIKLHNQPEVSVAKGDKDLPHYVAVCQFSFLKFEQNYLFIRAKCSHFPVKMCVIGWGILV